MPGGFLFGVGKGQCRAVVGEESYEKYPASEAGIGGVHQSVPGTVKRNN